VADGIGNARKVAVCSAHIVGSASVRFHRQPFSQGFTWTGQQACLRPSVGVLMCSHQTTNTTAWPGIEFRRNRGALRR
jgi:hypothetical protein